MSEFSTLPPGGVPHRARGYLPDRPDERDLPVEKLFGFAPTKSEIVVPASMIRYHVGILDQRDASSCVAFALTRAVDMRLRVDAERSGLGSASVTLGAPGFVYFNARQQEIVEAMARGSEPRAIGDNGSYPRLAMRAIQRLGYCPEASYPYEAALTEIRAARLEARPERPPPTMTYRHAYDQAGLRYYRVSSSGQQRVADVARAIGQQAPVVFGMFVDTAFMQNRGDRITSINDDDPDGGGHMMCVVGVTLEDVVITNSWGAAWGQNGIARISHALFGSFLASDVYAVVAAPSFSSEAA